MSTDNLVTAEQLAGALKMAVEGMKKKPGLMKFAIPHMQLIHKYVENIATAKEKGKWVIAHGTQQPSRSSRRWTVSASSTSSGASLRTS